MAVHYSKGSCSTTTLLLEEQDVAEGVERLSPLVLNLRLDFMPPVLINNIYCPNIKWCTLSGAYGLKRKCRIEIMFILYKLNLKKMATFIQEKQMAVSKGAQKSSIISTMMMIIFVCLLFLANSIRGIDFEVAPYYKVTTLLREADKVECVRFGPKGIYYSKPYQIVLYSLDSSSMYVTQGAGNFGTGERGDTNGARYWRDITGTYSLKSKIDYPYKFAFHAGRSKTYFALANHQVKLDTDDVISPFIGKPNVTGNAEGDPTSECLLNDPQGVDVSFDGDFVYVADTGNNLIKYTSYKDGVFVISNLAGTGNTTSLVDGVNALQVDLNRPVSVRFSKKTGEIYIAEKGNHVIRKVRKDNIASVAVGSIGISGYNGDFKSSLDSFLSEPSDIAISTSGVIYIADSGNNRVRKVYQNGTITTVCGNGMNMYGGDSLDSRRTAIGGVNSVDVNENGELVISHMNYIRKLTPICYNGYVFNSETHLCNPYFQCFGKKHTEPYVCSGRGSCINHNCICKEGFEGEKCETISKVFNVKRLLVSGEVTNLPPSILAANMKHLQVSNTGDMIVLTQDGILGRLVGNSLVKVSQSSLALFYLEEDGSILTTSTTSIIKIGIDGAILSLVKTTNFYDVDGVSPTNINIGAFSCITQDQVSKVYYVTEYYSNVFAKVENGKLALLISNTKGFADGLKNVARSTSPKFVYAYGGTVIFSDYNRIRMWKDYTTTTIAGNGIEGYNGNNVPKLACSFGEIVGFHVVRKSATVFWIYVSDSYSRTIRLIKTNENNVTIIAGSPGTGKYMNFEDNPKKAIFSLPIGLSMVNDTLYFIDQGSSRIMSLSPDGTKLTTIAGGRGVLNVGENLDQRFSYFGPSPTGIYLKESPTRELLISDSNIGRIRKSIFENNLWGNVTTLAGTSTSELPVDKGMDGDCLTCAFLRPSKIRFGGNETLLVSESINTVKLINVGQGSVRTLVGTPYTNPLQNPSLVTVNTSAIGFQIDGLRDAILVGDELVFAEKSRILKVNSQGLIEIVAGDGNGYSCNFGNYMSAKMAKFGNNAVGTKLVTSLDYYDGEIYILEEYALRKVNSKGIMIPIISGQGTTSWSNGVRKLPLQDASIPACSFMKVVNENEIYILSTAGQLYIVRNGTVERPIITKDLSFMGPVYSQFYSTSDGEFYMLTANTVELGKMSCPSFSKQNENDTCENMITCFGLKSTDQNVCSTNGKCSALDTCICNFGWSGVKCNESTAQLVIQSLNPNRVTTDDGLDIGFKTSSSPLTNLKVDTKTGIVYLLSGGKTISLNGKTNDWVRSSDTTSKSMIISKTTGYFYFLRESCIYQRGATPYPYYYSGNCYTKGSVLGTISTASYNNLEDGDSGEDGSLYIVDSGNHVVRLISEGVMSTFCGSFGVSGLFINSNSSTKTFLKSPRAIKVTSNGVYIADSGNYRILFIDKSGHVQKIAGSSNGTSNGDGKATLTNIFPSNSLDYSESRQELYFIDNNRDEMNSGSVKVRKITKDGYVETLFGYYERDPYSNLTVPMTITLEKDTSFYAANSLAVSGDYLYLTFDSVKLIAKVSLSTNTLYVVSKIGSVLNGDGFHVGFTTFQHPSAPYFHSITRTLYWVEMSSIRMMRDNKVYTVVGLNSNIPSFGKMKPLWKDISPKGIALSSTGELYFSDGQHVIYKILNSRSDIEIVWGKKGVYGSADTLLENPTAIFINSKDELYIADSYRIIKFDITSKKITKIVSKSDVYFGICSSVIELSTGEIVYVDSYFKKVRMILNNGTNIIIAGGGLKTGVSNGDLATKLLFTTPVSVQEINTGVLLLLEQNSLIKMTWSPSRNGYICSIIAGKGLYSMTASGNGGLAINAVIYNFAMSYNTFTKEVYLLDNVESRIITPYCPEGFTFNISNETCQPVDMCFGFNSNDNRACSGRGECVGLDACNCFGGYSGIKCEIMCHKTCEGTVVDASFMLTEFSTDFSKPGNLVVDSEYIYVSDSEDNVVKRFDKGGYSSIYCGIEGQSGNQGNGLPGTEATLNSPLGLSVYNNELFIADFNNSVIRKVDAFGFVDVAFNTTEKPLNIIARGENVFYYTDSTSLYMINQSVISTIATGFDSPYGLFYYSNTSNMEESLLVADTNNNSIKKVSLSDRQVTIILSNLNSPKGLFIDSFGDLYIADSGSNQILKYSGGVLKVIAGTSNSSMNGTDGAINSLQAILHSPSDLIVTDEGIIYFTDSQGYAVKTLTPVCDKISMYDPILRKCFRPLLCFNFGIDDKRACSSNGQCVAENTCNCNDNWGGDDCSIPSCFNISASSTTTVCSGHGLCIDHNTCRCDTGWSGADCSIASCYGIKGDNSSVCYGNGQCVGFNQCSCNNGWSDFDCLTPSCFGLTYDLDSSCSGNGKCISNDTCECYLGYQGPDCSTVSVDPFQVYNPVLTVKTIGSLNKPKGVTVSSSGDIYFSDTSNNKLKKILQSDWSVSLIAGTGTGSFSGDGSSPTAATINNPIGLDITENGEVYFADSNNNRVRKCSYDGKLISTVVQVTSPQQVKIDEYNNRLWIVASGGVYMYDLNIANMTLVYSNDLNTPFGIDIGYQGKIVYITDKSNHVIRKLAKRGNSYVQSIYFGSKGVTGTYSSTSNMNNPMGISVTNGNSIIFSDSSNHVIKLISHGVNKTTSVIVGTGSSSGYSATETKPLSMALNTPGDVFVNEKGIYIADTNDNAIRIIKISCPYTNYVFNYYTSKCEFDTRISCNKISFSSPNVCNGKGVCYGVDKCNCTSGWNGTFCEIPICFGVSNPKLACSSNGQCISNNTCSCNDGWFGSICQNPSCFGISYNDSNTCSGNGQCIANNTCSCDNFYEGKNCSLPKCFGINSDSSLVCSGNGLCVSPDTCNCTSGYFGNDCFYTNCFGILSGETTVCSSKGNCTAPNTCFCEKGYYGNQCQNFTCFGIDSFSPNACSSRGSCIDIDKCKCGDDFYGSNCTGFDCFGYPSTNPNTCSGKGDCLNPNTCICNDGYAGERCEIARCFGVYGNESNVCDSHGECVSLDNCTCTSLHHYGDNCDRFDCFGIESSNSSVCSSHGNCTFLDICNCSKGYEGLSCSEFNCFGKKPIASDICSGNGICTGPNICNCKDGYFGDDCQITNCYGIHSNESSVCSSNGRCISLDSCSCSFGYYGEMCQEYDCFGMKHSNTSVCSQHGTCHSPNNCTCNDGYHGADCDRFNCFGVSSFNSSVCSSRGYCKLPNVCSCTGTFYGENCEQYDCFGINYQNSNVCSSHGKCIGADACQCYDGYISSNCSVPLCFGISALNSSVCRGHGYCTSPNKCDCISNQDTKFDGQECQNHFCKEYDGTLIRFNNNSVCSGSGVCKLNRVMKRSECVCSENYGGESCEMPKCFGILQNETSACNNNGFCSSVDTCECHHNDFFGYWKGSNCTQCQVPYSGSKCNVIKECNASVCHNNGICDEYMTCICNSNQTHGFWNAEFCNVCQEGYYGKECSTQMLGPLKLSGEASSMTFKMNAPISFSKTSVNCTRFLREDSYETVGGLQSICSWNNSMMKVTFGASFDVKSGRIIYLNRLVFDESGYDYEPIKLEYPDTPILPTAIVESNKLVGSCDSIIIDGSKSYSPDSKPLSFSWKVVNSPNINSLQHIVQSQTRSILSIDSSNCSTGVHIFELIVKSSILELQSIPLTISITKAEIPLPTISIDAQASPLTTSKLPYKIMKSTVLPDCAQSLSMIYNWKLVSGRNDIVFEMDQFNNLVIINYFLEDSSYEFECSVFVEGHAENIITSKVSFSTKISPLSSEIRLVELSTNYTIIQLLFRDPEIVNEEVNVEWECIDLDTKLNCSSSLLSHLSTLPLNSEFLISGSLLSNYNNISLKSTIKKGKRISNSELVVTIPQKTLPPIISPVYLSPSNLALGSSINLQFGVTIDGSDDISSAISRKWTLNNVVIEKSDSMRLDPSESNSLILATNSFTEGATYKIDFKVTDQRNNQFSIYSYSFSIKISPKCTCTISPSSGYALQTLFTFACTDCKNNQGPLSFEYGFIDSRYQTRVTLSKSSKYSAVLPSSYQGNTLNLYAVVSDSVSQSSSYLSAEVLVPVIGSLAEAKKKQLQWKTTGSSLKDGDYMKSVYSNDVMTSTFTKMIASLLSARSVCNGKGVLNNGKCQCDNGYSSFDCRYTTSDYVSIQESVFDLSNDFKETFGVYLDSKDILSEKFVANIIFGLETLTNRFDFLNETSFDIILSIVDHLLEEHEKYSSVQTSNGVDTLLLDILDHLYSFTEYYEIKEQLMSKLIEISQRLSSLESRKILVGQPPLILSNQLQTSITNKHFREEYSGLVIRYNNYSTILPESFSKHLSNQPKRVPVTYSWFALKDLSQFILPGNASRIISKYVVKFTLEKVKYLELLKEPVKFEIPLIEPIDMNSNKYSCIDFSNMTMPVESECQFKVENGIASCSCLNYSSTVGITFFERSRRAPSILAVKTAPLWELFSLLTIPFAIILVGCAFTIKTIFNRKISLDNNQFELRNVDSMIVTESA
ncbi:predicted protein [Naegleria gruberi]|uniref:Predicted protein n=1 Tax=Naegleria gruberi TaxID=5762 RepID=D2VYF1_NAEGR|nr:uncharacterized protein NAEGRDRAFT_53247 [Naegleria gruberi]EFC38199.1 predicted protein [Naegleria gruberi]|eukprot:XP_002670943.1 predicted protein [Naegleria gruberi strain NEG-M]